MRGDAIGDEFRWVIEAADAKAASLLLHSGQRPL
jgi:hypothetical protein